MEFLTEWLGGRKKKQDKLLTDLGLNGQVKKDKYVGPDFKKGDTLNLKPDEFLRVIEERNIKTINAEAGRGDDTYIPHSLFAEVDEGLKLYIETGATELLYRKFEPNEYETLLPKLYELGFRWDPELHKENWSVYKREI